MKEKFSSIKNILLIEPENVENLYPFSVMHCAWELRVGAFRIFEKWQKCFPDKNFLFRSHRTEHLASFHARFDFPEKNFSRGKTLMIAGNILPSEKFLAQLHEKISLEKNFLFTLNSRPVAAMIPEENFSFENFSFENFSFEKISVEQTEIEAHQIEYLWQTLDFVAEQIEDDAEFFREKKLFPEAIGFHEVGKEKIYYGNGVKISPGVVLDASEGPIILDENVKVMPNSVIIGPCYIGKNSIIKIGAKIYEKTSIGEFCKVGGEVENSIILGYSNKQHDGFLGHSYLCEWVNLGADTNTSDLKNTYGKISVKLRNEEINTGRMFLGLLCGDHTKSGINTMFTTGTVAGISSNVFGAGYPPSAIPSYSWGGMKDSPQYDIEKAVAVARTVMERRNKNLTNEEEILLRKEFERK